MSGLPYAPMLAVPSTGQSNRQPILFEPLMRTGKWVADTKIDGIRAFALMGGKTLQLINRNGVDITHKYPELVKSVQAGDLEGGWYDGEIVCENGSFADTLIRDKQESAAGIARGAIEHPVRFVAFDLPALETNFSERRACLESRRLNGRWSLTVVSTDVDFLQRTRELGLEGVVAKRKDSRYQFGRRSADWVKFKNLHRVSCLAAGYAPGNGSRSEFGAIELVLVGGAGDLVPCGRVGTGWSVAQGRDLKARLDAGQVLVLEIECLNVTSGGVLRFPVYKGIRTDVGPLDATIKQLQTIPVC